MRIPSLNRFSRVTSYSLLISLIACFSLAIPGYLSFTDQTQGNILNNFPLDDTAINVARIIFAFTMYLTYPMELFVTREVLTELLFKSKKSDWIHYPTTIFLVALSFAITAIFSDLGVVFELTGGFSASMVAYIMPPACYIKLSSKNKTYWRKVACWCLLIFGVIVMILSTFFTIYNQINK